MWTAKLYSRGMHLLCVGRRCAARIGYSTTHAVSEARRSQCDCECWNVPPHVAGAAACLVCMRAPWTGSAAGMACASAPPRGQQRRGRGRVSSCATAGAPGAPAVVRDGFRGGWVLGQPRRCALALPPPAAATPHGWRRRPAARCNSPGGGRRPRCFATGYIWAARRDCGVCKTRGLSAHGPWKPARRREASVPPAPATAPRLTSRRRGVASLCCCETRRLTLLQRAARVAGGRTLPGRLSVRQRHSTAQTGAVPRSRDSCSGSGRGSWGW
jgi:hypothetical protein